MHVTSSIVSLVRGGGSPPLRALALGLGIWGLSGLSARAQGGRGFDGLGRGTLGYGGYDLYPGFSGFGLSYHLGYGYGGNGLGVGAHGGYPYYGGPGYPHGEPRLRWFGKLSRLPYHGGPGYPRDGYSNDFEGIGPLVVDQPVVTGSENRDFGEASGYGPFTGALPYPDTFFAPAAAAAAGSASASGAGFSNPSRTAANNAPATGESTRLAAEGRYLGIEQEPVVDEDGVRGIKVSDVYPGSAAEKAGLHVGDVIHSINGHLTTGRTDLAWIIDNTAPDNLLKMNVRTAIDGKEHTITARLAIEPAKSTRPSPLPPVGNGPPPPTR